MPGLNLDGAKVVDSGSDSDDEVEQIFVGAGSRRKDARSNQKSNAAVARRTSGPRLGKSLTLLNFGMRDSGSAAEVAANPIAKLVPYGLSAKAREYIAVGFFEAACTLCQEEEDVVGWAVALTLSGNAAKAVHVLEAYVESACVAVFKHIKKIDSESMDAATLPTPTAPEVERVLREVCTVASMRELHQWYLTSVMLHGDYEPTTKVWVRHFFSLNPHVDSTRSSRRRSGGAGAGGKPRAAATAAAPGKAMKKRPGDSGGGKGGASKEPHAARQRPLTAEHVERAMIEQSTEEEIAVITAYVSFALCRFKTALEACDIVLNTIDSRDICMRFLRACCALQLGLRSVANDDITFLMRTSILIVRAIGNVMAAYSVPMPSALNAIKPDKFSIAEQEYVYCFGEWCHALLLLQLGQFSAARGVAASIAPRAPSPRLQFALCDVACIASVLLADETHIPKLVLTPMRQLHLTLVSAFGGGFDRSGIGCADDVVAELLSVKFLSQYCDARQAMVLHTLRARSLYSFGKLEDAWEEICAAVEAADELLGTVEFAMCECAPHRVVQYGIKFGLDFIDRLIEEGGTEEPDESDVVAVKKREEDDAKGDAILAMAKAWAARLRSHAPRLVGGYCTVVSVMIASNDANSIERAITLTELFPKNLTALNLLSLALFQKHLVPDATLQAQRVLDQFPHVPEARKNYRDITGDEATYTFMYRGVLPISFTDGMANRLGARTAVVFTLLVVHMFVFLAVLTLNLSAFIPFTSSMDGLVEAVQLPWDYPVYAAGGYALYVVVATAAPRSLLSVAFHDLNMLNTRMNRFLFSARTLIVWNMACAAAIYVSGNRFTLEWLWGLLILVGLLLTYLPFTTRAFFLRSVDEPKVPIPFWFAMLIVDFVTFIFFATPHVLLAAVEPIFFVLYALFIPSRARAAGHGFAADAATTIGGGGASNRELRSVVGRIIDLAGSGKCSRNAAPQLARRQWNVGSGSHFIYIMALKALYFDTHSSRDSLFALKKQQQGDDLLVFPLIKLEAEASIPTAPRELPASLAGEETHRVGFASIRNLQLTGLTTAEIRAQAVDPLSPPRAERTREEEGDPLGDAREEAGEGGAAPSRLRSFKIAPASAAEAAGVPSLAKRVESFRREALKQRTESRGRLTSRRAQLDAFFQENEGGADGGDMFSMGAVNRGGKAQLGSTAASSVGRSRVEEILAASSSSSCGGGDSDSWDLAVEDVASEDEAAAPPPQRSRAGSRTEEELEKDIDRVLTNIGSMKDLRESLRRTSSMQGTMRRRRSSVGGGGNSRQPSSALSGAGTPGDARSAEATLSRQSSGPLPPRRSDSMLSRGGSTAAAGSPPQAGDRERRQTLQPGEVVSLSPVRDAGGGGGAVGGGPQVAPTARKPVFESTLERDRSSVGSLMRSFVLPMAIDAAERTGTGFSVSAAATTTSQGSVTSSGKGSGSGGHGAGTAAALDSRPGSGGVSNPLSRCASPSDVAHVAIAPQGSSVSGAEVAAAASSSSSWQQQQQQQQQQLQRINSGGNLGMTKRSSLVTIISPDEKNFSKQNQDPAKAATAAAAAAAAAAAVPRIPSPPTAARPVAKTASDFSPRPPRSPPPAPVVPVAAAAKTRGGSAISSATSSSRSLAAGVSFVSVPNGGRGQDDDELLTESDGSTTSDEGDNNYADARSSRSRDRDRSRSGSRSRSDASPPARAPGTGSTMAALRRQASMVSRGSGSEGSPLDRTDSGGPQLLTRRSSSAALLSHHELGEKASTHNLKPKLPPTMHRAANQALNDAVASNVASNLARRPESSEDGSMSIGGNSAGRRASTEVSGQDDKLRRADSLPQTMREMLRRAEENRTPGVLPKPVNGNIKLRRILDELRQTRAAIKANSDDVLGAGDMGRIEFLKHTLQNAKQKAINEIERIGERIAVEATDTKTAIASLLEELIKETDKPNGNSLLVACLMKRVVTLDFATMIMVNNWLNKVVVDGSPGFLNVFLELPEVATGLTLAMAKDLITGCVRHKTKKSPLMLVLVKCSIKCPIFETEKERLEPLWQEAFEILASSATYGPDDDRTGRYEALDFLLLHPCVQLDFTREARDKQTIFSRAAREGEVKILQMLLHRKKIADLNRVQSDKTNALMQAAARNQTAVVDFLLKLDAIKPSLVHTLPGKGSTIEIAANMKRDPKIINALRTRATELGVSHKGGEPGGGGATAADGAGSPAFLLSPEQLKEKEQRDAKDAVDATNAIKILLATMAPLQEQLKRLETLAAPTHDEIAQLRQCRQNIEMSKKNMVAKLERLGAKLVIKTAEVAATLLDMLTQCIVETDRRGGNMELLTAVNKRVVSVDLARAAIDRRWLVMAAANGSVHFMSFLAELATMPAHITATTTKECLLAALKNRIERVAVSLHIVDHADVYNILAAQMVLRPLWQQLFEDIASNQRANPQEHRTGRMDLLKKLMRHPHIHIDFTAESDADHQTIFSRAAVEGDGDLVALILRSKCCDAANRVQSDGTTALIQAIRGGHTAVIEEMLPFAAANGGDVNLNVATPLGTALDVLNAFPHRHDLQVIKARLVELGAQPGGARGGGGAVEGRRR